MARCAEPRQQPHASPQCRKCGRGATLPTPTAPNMSEVLHGGNAPDTRIPQYVGSAARSRRSRHLQLQICRKCGEVATLTTNWGCGCRKQGEVWRKAPDQCRAPRKSPPGQRSWPRGDEQRAPSEARHTIFPTRGRGTMCGLACPRSLSDIREALSEGNEGRPAPAHEVLRQPIRWGLHPRSYPSRSTRCRCPRPRSWSGSSARRRCTAPHGWCSQHWTPRT